VVDTVERGAPPTKILGTPSVRSEEIGWEERLGNDLFCVVWDAKPKLSQSGYAVADEDAWGVGRCSQ